MAPKSSGKTAKNNRPGRSFSDSSSTSNVSCNNVNNRLDKATLHFDCLRISTDVRPTQRTPDTRIFREIFNFDTLTADDWIVNTTLEKCPRDAHYQQQQEQIDILTAENINWSRQSKRFQIYNILCEALRFCGDKVILPRIKEANKDNTEGANFLKRFENWTQVTQFLRRSSRERDDDQRWLQMEINKVVVSGHFYMYANQWHELFNLKLPRDQAVHAALTSDDIQNLYENADVFGVENVELIRTLVKRMHRSIPKEAYATIPITTGPISNPAWPRI